LVEYHIIHPDPLIPNLGITNFITLTIIMIMFVALVEELVFRSILQTRLQQSMDNWNGLLVASILFGVMHSGYGLVHEVVFMVVAGLIIGYAYQKTGSLPFVVMVHGMINILLFGLLPYTL
jgi:membrane protease YdiL (CAAX protease family)